MIVTSFDIGVVNMAVAVGTYYNTSTPLRFKFASNTDLRTIHCKKRRCPSKWVRMSNKRLKKPFKSLREFNKVFYKFLRDIDYKCFVSSI